MGPKGLSRTVALVLPLVFAGCVGGNGAGSASASDTPGSSQSTKLSVANWTTIPVTLVVNGSVIETIPAGGYEDPIKASLPAMPWNVETRSPGGRVLSALVVHTGDFVTWTSPGGGGGARGVSVRVDLSCGRLDLWYGTPILGPPPAPNASYLPGDCA